MSQVRGGGQEELPHAPGQGQRLRGITPPRKSGALPERSYPTSKKQLLHGLRRAERSYSMFKVRRGGLEKIPLIQGKEQQLRFSGAAVKRYPKRCVQGKRNPSKTVGVARGQKRADTLRP